MPKKEKYLTPEELLNIAKSGELSDEDYEKAVNTVSRHLAAKAKSISDLSGKNGLLSQMFGKAIQDMLEAEMSTHLGYEKHSDSGDGLGNIRNGTTSKTIITSGGKQEISVPRDRNGSFEPKILPKYKRSTNDVEDKIIAMYSHNMSTRDIHDTLEEMYGIDVSAEYISNVMDKIIPEIAEWQARALQPIYPIIFLDAIHLNIRMDGKVENRAVHLCLGIDKEGYKSILGMWVSPQAESANFWLSVCSELQSRGVKDILIACVDGLTGFKDAIKAIYPNTVVQRCIIHQIRNSIRYVSWKDRKTFITDLKAVYKAPTEEEGLRQLDNLRTKWWDKYKIAIKSWENAWSDLSPFYGFPEQIRRIIYTTNSVESFNKHLRKSTKTKGSFPSETAAMKTLYLSVCTMEKKWDKVINDWPLILNQLSIIFEGRLE
jgi:transposase-like protein